MTEDTRAFSGYTESMQQLRDSIAPLAAEFGIATARSLIIQRRWRENNQPYHEIYEIEPLPIIGRRQPSINNADNTNISVKQDLLVVEGISRKYPREKIVGTGINYWVDGLITSSGVNGGFQCEFYDIEELPLTWNLILRRILDERRGV